MPNNDDQLAKQYQEILNKYASSISPPPPTDTSSEAPPVDTLPKEPETLSPEPIIETPKLDLEPKVDQMPINIDTPPVDTQPKEPEILPPEPVVETPKLDLDEKLISPPIYFPPEPENNKSSNFFKYLFYFSFLLFIGVVSVIIYNFINSQQTPVEVSKVIPTSTPTKTVSQFCELGDRQILVGESFPSADSCNTCSCTSNLTIVCTQKVCISPTAKPVSQKIYKDIKYGYQFSCPTTDKYQIVATSVDGNKIPFKQETCTSPDSIAYVSVYDNTVIHSFGDIKTEISPDKKYIITFEGDFDNIVSTFKFL
jgi:hypothetical protein